MSKIFLQLHRAEVLYDRPKEEFRPISIEQKHELFEKISEEYPETLKDSKGCNKFTKLSPDRTIEWRQDRPGLIVSSTSWTPDEDFSLLLDALQGRQEKNFFLDKILKKVFFQSMKLKSLQMNSPHCQTLFASLQAKVL